MRTKYPAVFARGGTSKALIFHQRDLPPRPQWDAIFLAALGSPDPYGRQLDGMGGGVSSLSKVCVVGPSTRPDADVDYTFAQVQVREAAVDYGGNCGNMSSAIGPFAVDEGLVSVADGPAAVVRIHNTNTGKVIHATFAVQGGRSADSGDLAIPGVAGTGASVRLDFLAPGGASTGRLLPTGAVLDMLQVPGLGAVQVSMVDAANACVFIEAAALGLTGTELPDELDARPDVLAHLAAVRLQASVAMGIAGSVDEARSKRMIPLIAFVAPPQASRTLDGETLPADAVDLVVRMISNGQPHRALPLTGSLCTAVAAQLPGSLVQRCVPAGRSGALRLAMPSGILTVAAQVAAQGGGWQALHGSFYRTTRRLFEGFVWA
ncbi:MAG: PrpF domain-containing protein [Burkholderiales bacterium]